MFPSPRQTHIRKKEGMGFESKIGKEETEIKRNSKRIQMKKAKDLAICNSAVDLPNP